MTDPTRLDPMTDPIAKAEPSALYFYHTDPAGTALAMTNTSGTVVWKTDYKPFGEEQSITGTIENNEKFAGKEKDKETGLYYFGARYLGPKTGRFITVDPAGIRGKDLLNPQRLNRYAYSLNNPYRYIDPDGNTVWDIADFAFFAHSAYKFAKEPSWSNAGELGLDAVGLLPIVPSLGVIKAVGKGLSSNIAKTFAKGKYRSLILKNDVKAYRYSGGLALEEGRWLTTKQTVSQISSPEDAKSLLNLPEGNTAEKLTEFIIPKGTEIYTGRVAEGGKEATQIFIIGLSA